MSKLIELIETVENEFNSNEHKTLQNMYGMPESIKRILTLTKIIRLQHSALESVYLNTRPERMASAETRVNIIAIDSKRTLEEINRIAGGE